MASFAGIKLPTAGERAYDRGQAEGELANIEAAEAGFLRLLDGWLVEHDGDRKIVADYIGDFLSDYFYERRRDALDELGLDEDDWVAMRDSRIERLATGGRL